jgi:hypothetical protein
MALAPPENGDIERSLQLFPGRDSLRQEHARFCPIRRKSDAETVLQKTLLVRDDQQNVE